MPNEKFASEIFLPCRFMLRRNKITKLCVVTSNQGPINGFRVFLPLRPSARPWQVNSGKAREVAQPL
jgi:hypothetical protein